MTEHEAQQLDTIFKLISQAVPDVFILADINGYIMKANHAVESVFGYRVDELVTAPPQLLEILMPERFRPPHRAAIQRLKDRKSVV